MLFPPPPPPPPPPPIPITYWYWFNILGTILDYETSIIVTVKIQTKQKLNPLPNVQPNQIQVD